jgi:hypothetical protein
VLILRFRGWAAGSSRRTRAAITFTKNPEKVEAWCILAFCAGRTILLALSETRSWLIPAMPDADASQLLSPSIMPAMQPRCLSDSLNPASGSLLEIR